MSPLWAAVVLRSNHAKFMLILCFPSILAGEASSLVSRRKHDAHPSNAIGGDVSVAIMVKTVCKLLCSPSSSAASPSPLPPIPQVTTSAAASKGRRNRHSRVQGMSESEVSDAGSGNAGGPVDAATTIDGKSRLHLLTCLLHLIRLAPRSIQPHWLQVSSSVFYFFTMSVNPDLTPFVLAHRRRSSSLQF
jgi:hypothetical protein